ncbi:hypothetical protein NG798_15360 [Ancylothrix sp. C2]|nr:hypothetical protein [Ancylothrix sp. D3o]
MTENTIKRHNLIQSLITGVILGALILGAPLGWFAHRFYSEQRLAKVLICREKNQDKPASVVDSMCGTWF